jgi:hypothetical protein
MTDDERLENLLRAALPPVDAGLPARDLWPRVVGRWRAQASWSWLDLGLALAAAAVLAAFPEWLRPLAYHL